MPKRPYRPRDPMQRAKMIGDIATGQLPNDSPKEPESAITKARRKGGLKGGKARAKTLSTTKRRRIAKKAAQVRWHKSRP